jgi:hypothetical protein
MAMTKWQRWKRELSSITGHDWSSVSDAKFKKWCGTLSWEDVLAEVIELGVTPNSGQGK